MENNYKTDDILLGAYLLTNKVVLIGVINDGPRHFSFIFQNDSVCEQLKREYLNNGQAPARELFSHRELLLSEIKNGNRDGYRNNYG